MQCNPELFISEDHPYILAFSLIMLHTDAFNPSNKRKMTKGDYIKNTKLPGISTEVLDCFFDNIVFAPFIFIEDPVDFNGQPGLTPDVARSMTINSPSSALSTSTASAFKMGNKVDPYYLIANNLLDPLKIDVNTCVPLENPYNHEGTNGPWDEAELHRAFVHASVIEIEAPTFNRAAPIFSLSPSGTPSPFLLNGEDPSRSKVEPWSLKITKVGLLNRKDDFNEGGKKFLNRKWKTWSVVLTGSQLLFFRDPVWASTLQPSLAGDSPRQPLFPPASIFRPDELFSVKDAIAVYDRSYTKHKHTLRLVLADGRHILLQAADEKDMNEWISRTNYASTFKSAGVRMRPPELSGEDVHLTGVAAATSHLHDMQAQVAIPRPRSWDSNAPNDLMDMLTGEPRKRRVLLRRVTLTGGRSDFDPDVPVAPEIDGAEQFKATFDQVKADLAAGYSSSPDEEPWLQDEGDIYGTLPASPLSFSSQGSRLPSRSQIIRSKIRELDSKIASLQSQLDHDIRYIRNIAILTPFQKTTRSRLSMAIQNTSGRVMQVRLDMEKVRCHRSVLRRDLVSEDRCWSQSKRGALRAAKETLQSRPADTVPAMKVSLLDEHSRTSNVDIPDVLSTPPSPQPPSSSCESFHSAIDEGIEWPSSEDLTFLTVSQIDTDPASPPRGHQKSMPLSNSNVLDQQLIPLLPLRYRRG
ncbi:hypothetical protein NLJ89_g903 [Agrocybe chaxingu]|uniref:Uncharacterized protein n=1 Tax=Agrocybe chaxingu TaxID=84603 RepID=A0A9W8N150_9AGAR|nr:hypothetical protein NLJ89_g903 [Agrocybe chaxingu]